MKTTREEIVKWRLLVLLLSAAMFPLGAMAQGQITVISNTSIKAAQISREDLRDAFTGVSGALKDGSRISPVLLKDGVTHDTFLKQYIGKSDVAFRANWRSLLFSGQGSMPHTLESDAEVIDYVARTPGTIGYVLKVTPHESVKILAVK